jgi:hypothetical protein
MATEKYIVFPPGVDFSILLGERGVGIRGVELCDEEEEKEGESGSEDENAIEVDNINNDLEDGVLEDGHDDLDILSIPDPDDLREFSIVPPRVEQDDGTDNAFYKVSNEIRIVWKVIFCVAFEKSYLRICFAY